MKILGIDIGSSSVKSAVLRNGKVVGTVARAAFKTRHDRVRVEADANAVLAAVASAVGQIGKSARDVELIALSVMSPSWVAMNARGKPITPVITHQDRRSVDEAIELEKRVGKETFLKTAGNRAVPGGISVTTWLWYQKHERATLKQADLVGHLSTLVHREFTGTRVMDPSNASFTGLYNTCDQSGWSDMLCEAAGVKKNLLPDVMESNQVGGKLTRSGAAKLGLTEGLPMLAGIVDTSAAMLLSGASVGQFANNCGSTDVLGLLTAKALPHDRLLTRALGVGQKWMSVQTIAAAGSSLQWAQDQLFPDLKPPAFWKLVNKLARTDAKDSTAGVRFEPYLAGERTSVTQKQGSFAGLTLSTTREQLLSAMIEALATASAARIDIFKSLKVPMKHNVMVTGGGQNGLANLFHRDWPGNWTFYAETEATLRGLCKLTDAAA